MVIRQEGVLDDPYCNLLGGGKKTPHQQKSVGHSSDTFKKESELEIAWPKKN